MSQNKVQQKTKAPKDQNRWIILVDTVCDGWVPYEWKCEKGKPDSPVTYATEREAEKEVAEVIIEYLRDFIEDEREEMDLCEDCSVVPCTVSPEGIITTEGEDVIWSPFEDPSKYGR